MTPTDEEAHLHSWKPIVVMDSGMPSHYLVCKFCGYRIPYNGE